MELIKWEPFNGLDRFFDDRVFPSFPWNGLDLAVDVYEEKDKVVAKMALPGIKSDNIVVSIEGDTLTISGRREEETETKDKDYYSKEIRRGSFSRTVSLPRSVNAEKANAVYDDGVLVITAPIVPGLKEKVVRIKVKK